MSSRQKIKFKETDVGMIPADWRVKTLEEVCKKEKGSIISGPFGSNIGSRFFVETGIPVIRGNNLSIGFEKFIDDGFVFITPEKAEELHTWAQEDDLVFTAAGTLGQVGIIPKRRKFDKYIISNKQLRARLDNSLINPLFAYYWFKTEQMIKYIETRSTGSTIPLINLSVLKSLPMPYPDLGVQQGIAKILSDIDLKIELNQHITNILEEICRTFFKHWFIDFEFPDEEGRPYRSSGGEMVYEEELRNELPKGWRVGKLGEIVEFAYGKGLPQIKRRDGNYPVIGSNGIIGFHSDYLVKGPGIVIGRKGTLGEVYWVEENFFPIDTTFYLVDKLGSGALFFHYFLLRGKEFLKSSSDSAVPGLNRDSAYSNAIVIPRVEMISKFNNICFSIFEKKHHLQVQSRLLANIRDSLLPKLMSGKIRVPLEAK